MKKLVKMMKQGKMIKLMMMRSALGYPELGSALDFRDTLVSLCTVQVYRSTFNESLVANIKNNLTYLFSLAMDKTMSIIV